MYKIYNLVRNIKGNKKSYIAYSLILFIAIIIVIPLITIMSTLRKEIVDEAQLHGNQVTIQRSPQYISNKPATQEDKAETSKTIMSAFDEYSTNEYVKSVSLQQYIKVYSRNLEINNGNLSVVQEVVPYNYRLITNTSDNLDTVADQFGIDIVEGEYPSDNMQILVPQSLLSSLNLDVGDEVSIQLNNIAYNEADTLSSKSDEEFNCQIVGVYKLSADSPMQANTIITNVDSFTELISNSSDIKATYYLDDYKHVDDFIHEVNSDGLPENYYINIHASEISSVMDPLNALIRKLSNVVIVVNLLSVIIVIIIGLITLKKRKQEIHISRLLGTNRGELSIRIAEEIIAVSIIVGTFAIFVGEMLIKPVTKILINFYRNAFVNLINFEEFLANSDLSPLDLSGLSLDQIVNQLNPQMDIIAIIMSFAIIALLSIVFISIFANYINKYEVKDLLKE